MNPSQLFPSGKNVRGARGAAGRLDARRMMELPAGRVDTFFFLVKIAPARTVVDLISDVLPFSQLWYGEANAVSNAIGYAKFYSRSHDAVIRVYDESGNVIETHEHGGDFKQW